MTKLNITFANDVKVSVNAKVKIDKHNDTELIYGYNYEKQKFYLPPNKFYDTVDDLETALIKIYAQILNIFWH